MQISLPDYSIIKETYRSSRTTIVKAIQETSGEPVLLKVINNEYPDLEDVARIRNEYRLVEKLKDSGVVNVRQLEKSGNRPVIVMEDFGGERLSSYIPNGFPLEIFFTIAIKTAEILDEIHQKKIIHRNINPNAVLWNPDSDDVKIMDFENATELSQELKNEQTFSLLEDSLPYISPEQTGRMNRDVDYLTDYYSLGATFYEMLASRHAFDAEDTMGWIYCHIAKIPSDIGRFKPDIPKIVSDIILKMMAKNPEDRYQSLQGLIKDLEHCRKEWKRNRFVNQFELGRFDISDRFQISQKLYGRDGEIEALMNAFQAADGGETQLMMIAGFSGVGKTALVNEIRIPILQKKGYFIEGGNDQLRQGLPYSAVSAAFQSLARRLLAEPFDRLELWKSKLLEALHPNAQIILDLAPDFEKIIGKQPALQSLNPTEAHNRFLITIRKFINVFANRDHPLVIFLDDLQWTDISTLDLIADLVTHEKQYLLVIGSYRNNETSESHPLMVTLDQIQKSKSIKRLFLKPLNESYVDRIVAETLRGSAENIGPLSDLIFRKTNGNPFFVKELLRELYFEGLICFDYTARTWKWELEKIREFHVSDNVVRFLISRIKNLPHATQKTLQLASCIGYSFNLRTLALICETSISETARSLWDAIKQGILIPLDDRYRLVQSQVMDEIENFSDFGVEYKFSHDRIQQAFYSTIEENMKTAVHLSIGRLMLQKYDEKEVEQKLTDILLQLNSGFSLISEPAEQYQLARLNLLAGKKAKVSTAYKAAYEYLGIGMKVLPQDQWSGYYDLTFELTKEFTECAYLCGEFKEADDHSRILLDHARTGLEKAEVYRMQSLQYTITGELETAIRIGIEGLSLLGVKLSPAPARITIGKELLFARFNLGTKHIPDLANQPESSDPKVRTCLRMLIELGAPAYLLGNENLFAMTVLKGINLILKHGNTPESPMCYLPFGFLLGAVVGDWKAGYQFGALGLELVEQSNNIELKCRATFFYTVFIHAWNKTWKEIPDYLKKSIEAGYQSGDLFYLAYSCIQVIPWDPEIDLDTAIREGKKYLEIIRETRYEDAWYSAKAIQQFRLNLVGKTYDRFSLNTATFNEDSFLERNRKVGFVPGIALYHLYKLQICYHFENFSTAVQHAIEAEQPMNSMFGLPYMVEYCLYSFLATAAHYPDLPQTERGSAWKRLKGEYHRMKKWAIRCPENFSHHRLIMEGEIARISGRIHEAVNSFNKAIKEAQKNGFIRYEALANELTAKIFVAGEQYKIAGTYMKDALYCYNRWGATAKVNHIRNTYSYLFSTQEPERRSIESPENELVDHYLMETALEMESGELVSRKKESLDLDTISKASNTLSGEVVLEKLLHKLMYIVRENAGAEKAILILKEDSTRRLRVQAESIGDSETVVLQSQPLEENGNLSVSIVQYVARSMEHLVFKDAARQGEYIHDVYIMQQQPKSVLCMPIINQGVLVGVLYLENNVSTDAFTPERLKVLELLSSQSAISIRNAILYRTMEQQVIERTRAIRDLLDNTGQGFLTFDEDFRVHREYSKACDQFFGRVLVDRESNDEKGVDFVDLITEDPREKIQLKKLFQAVLQEKVTMDAIYQFFPEEIAAGSNVLSLEYKMISASHEQMKNRIMVILTNITREKELAEQLEKDEERNETILKIVKDQHGFVRFSKTLEASIRTIENTLSRQPEDINVDELFRHFHTIKGGAAGYSLNELVSLAHGIETELENVRRGEVDLSIDMIYQIKVQVIQLEQRFKHLLIDFRNFIPREDADFNEPVYRIPRSKIVEHRKALLEAIEEENREKIEVSITNLFKQPVGSVLRGFEITGQTLAVEMAKKVDIEIIGDDIEILFDRFNPLLSSLVHLVRNAIDHGIERPEERLEMGKSETGRLIMEVHRENGTVTFVFTDDGCGINEEDIAFTALKRKLVDPAWIASATKEEKLNLVFTPGFSSKEEVSQISGRGVGMDAVKAAVEELNGTISIDSHIGTGTRISISVPAESNT